MILHSVFVLVMATFLVTGANRGIGLEYCRQLKARGEAEIVAVCRQGSDELASLGVRVEAGLELSDSQAITDLVERLDGLPLDNVILNAGIQQTMGLMELDPMGIRRQLEINALSPLLLAQALVDQMPRGSKLVLMSSRMGSIEDNTSGGDYGYRMSKVALNMVGKSLAIDLEPRGIAVAMLHPGLVRTRMNQFLSGISPEQAVKGLLSRIDEMTMSNSGSFWHSNGELLPW